MINLGEGIKQARENLGMSQKTLAGLLGVQTQTVWRWEKGEREPSWEIIQNIANLLNAPQLTESVNDLGQSQKTIPLGLGYWGSVVDNAREIARNGSINDISLIETLLRSACEILADSKKKSHAQTPKDDTDGVGQHFDIHNNTMKAKNINVGTSPATALA